MDLKRLVTPFYLQMMGRNAVEVEAQLWTELVMVADTVDVASVRALIASGWRECVMGAWYSLRHNSSAVSDDVLSALRNSQGSLTSPVLIVASIAHVGDGCSQAIAEYLEADTFHNWGSASFASAALSHLGQGVPTTEHEEDVADLMALMQRATDLRKR